MEVGGGGGGGRSGIGCKVLEREWEVEQIAEGVAGESGGGVGVVGGEWGCTETLSGFLTLK